MNFISFLDGDKRSKHAEQIRQVRNIWKHVLIMKMILSLRSVP